ncbi:8845_t:CDS:2, partial [Cetraspora pellucida]
MSSNEINKVSKSSEYLDQLKTFLKESQIENFDYTQFIDIQPVYRSFSLSLYSAILGEQKYALKSLRNDWFFDHEEFSQFKRELRLLSTTQHRNIIKFYGVTIGNLMLILQFANGGNLRDHLKAKHYEGRYKIFWDELISIAKDITHGLSYLHDNGIIHRNLYSRNILINDGKALITDFGLSKRLNDSATTISSSIKGMPAYVDPQSSIINNIPKSFDSEGVTTSFPHSLFNANLNLNEHENDQMAATDNSLIRQPIMNSGVKIYDYKEFTSIKKIGEGGYGQVERAHWESENITVALKSLKVKVNSSKDMIEELVRE